MATANSSRPLSNGTHDLNKPIELSISLPLSPGTKIHAHLTVLATNIILFLTSASLESAQGGVALGSFVYAMPDKYNPTQPLSSTLYSSTSSVEFATRMAKYLARRTQRPCYVGCSVSLSSTAGGGSVEEEIAAFSAVAGVVIAEVSKAAASMAPTG